MKQRVEYIDIAKGMAMILIILMHTGMGRLDFVIKQTNYIHAPIFFFISGLFFNPKQDFTLFLKSKISRLIKPYFIWGVFIVFFAAITNTSPHVDMTHLLIGERCGAIWFLPSLFTSLLLVYAYTKLGKTIYRL